MPKAAGPSGIDATRLRGQTQTYLQAPAAFLAAYPVTANEIGVLTVEPYKAALLPLWRFRTAEVAATSAAQLRARFAAYGRARDFVGMDMARKFLQMGMTRARRYANHRGGRKYAAGKELPRSQGHPGKEDKERAADVFREAWAACKEDDTYAELKEEFLELRRAARDGEEVPETRSGRGRLRQAKSS